MKVKVESEKVGLKLNIQKTKRMASDPITSWEINGETMETVTDFLFLGSKITADGDCTGVLGTGLPGLGTELLPGALCSGTGSPALGKISPNRLIMNYLFL